MFDWKGFSFKLLSLAPVIVAGVEQIHGATVSGASKKDLAQASLLLASGVADATLPDEQKQIADNVSNATSTLIDSVVSIFNATGTFKSSKQPTVVK